MTPKKRILLGMSGGVDSSVAALLLQKKGYEVIGAFIKSFSDTKNKLTGECAWIEELKSAQKIAVMLDIKLITLDYEKEYKKNVINPLFAGYKKGLTPNPDILCNTIIKFPFLWKTAKENGAQYIATGHYVCIKRKSFGFQLWQGRDKKKDQSYFLADLKQKDLRHTLFPLGSLTKERVRMIAKENKFPNWNKEGTRGICFVGKQNMQKFLKQRITEKQGIVRDPERKIIGTHKGIFFYTIGQKAGENIGIVIKKPKGMESLRFYIVSKKIKKNEIIVAPENHPAMLTKIIVLSKFHKINKKEKIPSELKARIRHLGQLNAGTLIKHNLKYNFIFTKPQEAVAPGQKLVLYHRTQLIASGEIT